MPHYGTLVFMIDSAVADETRVAVSSRDGIVLAVALALAGGTLLVVAPRLAQRALGLPWVPFGGPLRLIDFLGRDAAWWALALIGLVLGAVVGIALQAAEPVITLSDRTIVITRAGNRIRFDRSQVTRASVEDRHLLLRGPHGAELADQQLDRDLADQAALALRRHGWSG